MKKTYYKPAIEEWCMFEEEPLAGSVTSSENDVVIGFGGFDEGDLDPFSRQMDDFLPEVFNFTK
jgi:hypothetical protein